MKTLQDIKKAEEIACLHKCVLLQELCPNMVSACIEMGEHKNTEFRAIIDSLLEFEDKQSMKNINRFNGDKNITTLQAEQQQAEGFYWSGYVQALRDIENKTQTLFDIKKRYGF